ncbi:hypothetical protein C7438_0623 [Brockia lithotrophica]|uniref:Uncharacterized protein n=1 Tax=Brockia lithotrophica TaxID=933949 RepID=A0A660LBJ1_9BACL|nr:hypothetical protein C7438_0623 [Brockia lithotrophica]
MPLPQVLSSLAKFLFPFGGKGNRPPEVSRGAASYPRAYGFPGVGLPPGRLPAAFSPPGWNTPMYAAPGGGWPRAAEGVPPGLRPVSPAAPTGTPYPSSGMPQGAPVPADPPQGTGKSLLRGLFSAGAPSPSGNGISSLGEVVRLLRTVDVGKIVETVQAIQGALDGVQKVAQVIQQVGTMAQNVQALLGAFDAESLLALLVPTDSQKGSSSPQGQGEAERPPKSTEGAAPPSESSQKKAEKKTRNRTGKAKGAKKKTKTRRR